MSGKDESSKKIYVVMGSTGEYSDQTEWPVCAYMDEKKAEERVLEASAISRMIFQWECAECGNGWRDHYASFCKMPKPQNKYDPNFEMDYTGTTYYLIEVNLVR